MIRTAYSSPKDNGDVPRWFQCITSCCSASRSNNKQIPKDKKYSAKQVWISFMCVAIILISIWIYLILRITGVTMALTDDYTQTIREDRKIQHEMHQQQLLRNSITQNQNNVIESYYTSSKLLSRSDKVIITSSVRGNLGPSSVLNQSPPGKDWIKDRWQAASDMGGTAIKGSHWVMLDFTDLSEVYITKIVLDWETAYAKDYRIEGRTTPPPKNEVGNMVDGWCTLYDGALEEDSKSDMSIIHRTEEEYGQLPGVKQKLPLHIVHTIEWTPKLDEKEATQGNDRNCHKLKYLRVFIRKPAQGWGVSLWQVDVFGTLIDER